MFGMNDELGDQMFSIHDDGDALSSTKNQNCFLNHPHGEDQIYPRMDEREVDSYCYKSV